MRKDNLGRPGMSVRVIGWKEGRIKADNSREQAKLSSTMVEV